MGKLASKKCCVNCVNCGGIMIAGTYTLALCRNDGKQKDMYSRCKAFQLARKSFYADDKEIEA